MRDLRARITDVVRHGWVSMTFGLVGFFGVYYVLFWFCLHAVGVHMSFGQIFAAYAVGRLLTAVGITPGGVGVTESGTAAVLVAWGAAPAGALAGVVLFSVYTHLMEIPLGAIGWLAWGVSRKHQPSSPTAAPGPERRSAPASPASASRAATAARRHARTGQALGDGAAPPPVSGRPAEGGSAGEPPYLPQPRLVGDGVVDVRRLEVATGGPAHGQGDQGVGEDGVGRQDRAVQVGAEHRAGDGALGPVAAVVAQARADRAERLLARAEHASSPEWFS